MVKTKSTMRKRSGPRKPLHGVHLIEDALNGKSLAKYLREQGAKPFDPAAFAKSFVDIIPPNEDMGAFVEEIYKART